MGILKNINEVTKLNPIITPRFIKDRFKVSTSFIAIDKPILRIGPIKGDISMAPITTAGELTLRPMEAINIEKTSTQAVCPFIEILSFTS